MQHNKTAPPYDSVEFSTMFFKVLPCHKKYNHDWTACPGAHPGERARRRCPLVYKYGAKVCPDMQMRGVCPRGEACQMTHGMFEYFMHPLKYKTKMCRSEANCRRHFCFFSHHPADIREGTDFPPEWDLQFAPDGSISSASTVKVLSCLPPSAYAAAQAALLQLPGVVAMFEAEHQAVNGNSGSSSTAGHHQQQQQQEEGAGPALHMQAEHQEHQQHLQLHHHHQQQQQAASSPIGQAAAARGMGAGYAEPEDDAGRRVLFAPQLHSSPAATTIAPQLNSSPAATTIAPQLHTSPAATTAAAIASPSAGPWLGGSSAVSSSAAPFLTALCQPVHLSGLAAGPAAAAVSSPGNGLRLSSCHAMTASAVAGNSSSTVSSSSNSSSCTPHGMQLQMAAQVHAGHAVGPVHAALMLSGNNNSHMTQLLQPPPGQSPHQQQQLQLVQQAAVGSGFLQMECSAATSSTDMPLSSALLAMSAACGVDVAQQDYSIVPGLQQQQQQLLPQSLQQAVQQPWQQQQHVVGLSLPFGPQSQACTLTSTGLSPCTLPLQQQQHHVLSAYNPQSRGGVMPPVDLCVALGVTQQLQQRKP